MALRSRPLVACVVLALAACSSSSGPPVLNTTGGGSGGGGSGGSGGSSGGSGSGGGDGGVCTVDPTSSQCDQCVASHCCADVETCVASSGCEMLLGCLAACTGSSCAATCEQAFPGTPATLYKKLDACRSAQCAICSQSGVGDPCGGTNDACVPMLTCGGSWCTRTCGATSECGGIGPGGGNLKGQPGSCQRTSSGNLCVPGCAQDMDCAPFPGTTCVVGMSIEGQPVSICGGLSDAGVDGPG